MITRNLLLTLVSFATLTTSHAQDQETAQAVSIKVLIDSVGIRCMTRYIFPEKSKIMAAHLKMTGCNWSSFPLEGKVVQMKMMGKPVWVNVHSRKP